jgi:hypothetical protein
MAAEIDRRQRRGAMVSPQQEGDRGDARRIPFQGFLHGPAQGGGAVQIQQPEQLRGLTAG